MIIAEYENIFTDNTKASLKDNALSLIKKWFIDHVQQKSSHKAAYPEAQAMKALLTKTPAMY